MLPMATRFQTINTVAEKDFIRDLDSALAILKIDYKLPFRRRLNSLRLFSGITRYALPEDYDELSYIDPNTKQEIIDRNRFKFQSFDQFLEDSDYRNDWCEFFEDGEISLGCRKIGAGPSRLIDGCESVSGFVASGDITAIALDSVTMYEGNASLAMTVVASSGTATIEKTLAPYAFSNSRIRRNYPFYALYIPAGVVAPTSLTLRFGVDNTNFFFKTVTTRFDGGAFRAGAWNIVAFDIDTASTFGSVPVTSTWNYYAVIMTGAESGTYFLDAVYLREWTLTDLWYFSKNMVQLVNGTFQQGFLNADTDDYATDTALIGPIEWAYVVVYAAMMFSLGDKTDNDLYSKVEKWLKTANDKLMARYKSVTPQITNSNWKFRSDFQNRGGMIQTQRTNVWPRL